ncbi:hypothetical protein EC991_002838 [Linnemannia zychae]|nr:hypothetical protein EC991_002838 [Linnemannia zychae]
MATTERQLAMARYGSQHICFTPTATPAPLRTPAPAPLRTPVPAPLRTPVPAPLRTPVPAPLRAPVPAPTRTTVPAPPRALAHAPLRALAPSPPRAHVPAPFRAPIIAPIPEPVARQEVDGLFLHEAVEATVSDRYPYDQQPDVDKDDYVTAVVKVLDQWTGQNSDVKPRQKSLKTGPHQTDKCNACLKGVCPLKPAQ